jgi:serine phosphatase RsbU (regulator of sigma subunit)
VSPEAELITQLTTLNHIAETLNRAVDVRSMLDEALADLLQLMGLETGWIFTRGETTEDQGESSYTLAAHCNLPPALNPDDTGTWAPGCACQAHLKASGAHEAYNVIQCSRLGSAQGDRRGLAVHASAPLHSGGRLLGILNVAGPDWASFSPQALTLLTNVGSQMGVSLERARLYDLLREQRSREQGALLEFSNQLLRRTRLGDLMDYLVDEVRQMLRADACALLLPGEEPAVLEFRAASGWRVDPVLEQRKVPANGNNGPAIVMHTQRIHWLEDLDEGEPSTWMPDWLRAEGFRGHAVVPLIAEGRSTGALVIDVRQPRVLDESDVRLLRLMANQAALAIEKVRLHQEELKAEGMERELELGQQIQLSMLPKATPEVPGWEFAVHYQAARQVGGDFYDLFELPREPDRLNLVIADVAGKGVPAALLMALSSTVMRGTAMTEDSPSRTLEQVNRVIQKSNRSELFLTAFYAALHTDSGRLVYARAGHTHPLWWQAATGKTQELAARGTVLGVFDEVELEERAEVMAPGDLLVVYTDGVTEAMDARHELFGMERLRAAVAATAGATAQQVVDSIVQAVRSFTGEIPYSDDMTVLVARRKPL